MTPKLVGPVLLLLGAGACTARGPVGDGGMAAAGDGGGSPGAVCRRLAAAQCSLLTRCFPEFQFESEQVCRLRYEAGCVGGVTSIDPWFESGAVSFTVDRAMACAQRLDLAACPPTLPPGYYLGWALPFPECFGARPLFEGQLPSGTACTSPLSCGEGSVCVAGRGACSGVCLAVGKEGETCGAACGPGLRCDLGGTSGDPTDDRCLPLTGVGASCGSSNDCESELRCLGGLCRPRGDVGEPCFWDPLRETTCAEGLVCDDVPFVGDAGSCVPRRGLGEGCRFHATCAGGLVCDGLDWSTFPKVLPAPGSCSAPKQKGESCLGTAYAQWLGEPCAPGLQCSAVTSTCEAPPQLGEPCVVPGTCAGIDIYCRPVGSGAQGLCSRPPEIGERCSFPLPMDPDYGLYCAEGWCDTKGTGLCHAPDLELGAGCDSDAKCASLRCAAHADGTQRCAEPCSAN